MENQPQNPEFRNNPESFTHVKELKSIQLPHLAFPTPNLLSKNLNICSSASKFNTV